MQIGTGFEIESLPYEVTTLDVEDTAAAERVSRAIVEQGRGGAFVVLRRGRDAVAQLIVNRCAGADVARLTSLLQEESARVAHGPDGSPTDHDPPGGALPTLTVVICTRDRPDGVARCLGSLASQTDPDFSVLVVDNSDEGSPLTRQACERVGDRLDVSYVHEPVAGLSRARNTGLRTADAEVLAWIDDDEEADESWVGQQRRIFADHPDVAVVLGRMLPARITTSADVLFEEFGGHNKGRREGELSFTKEGLGSRVFYPLPSFGTGGNMAFRREVAAAVGGFDPLLGAGSVCPAGEDTLFLSEALDHGYRLLSVTTSVTWHHHRGTEEELAAQLTNYGIGLGGYFAALLANRPRRLLSLAKLLPGALMDLFRPGSVRNIGHSERLLELRSGNRAAIPRGAGRYLRSRYRRRR